MHGHRDCMLIIGIYADTDNLVLQIVPVSPTTIDVQWMCTTVYNNTVTWKGMIKNAVEKWERMDTKVFDLCKNVNNLGQEVKTTITDLEEGVEYYFSIDGLSLVHFSTLTSGKHNIQLNYITKQDSIP